MYKYLLIILLSFYSMACFAQDEDALRIIASQDVCQVVGKVISIGVDNKIKQDADPEAGEKEIVKLQLFMTERKTGYRAQGTEARCNAITFGQVGEYVTFNSLLKMSDVKIGDIITGQTSVQAGQVIMHFLYTDDFAQKMKEAKEAAE